MSLLVLKLKLLKIGIASRKFVRKFIVMEIDIRKNVIKARGDFFEVEKLFAIIKIDKYIAINIIEIKSWFSIKEIFSLFSFGFGKNSEIFVVLEFIIRLSFGLLVLALFVFFSYTWNMKKTTRLMIM